MHERLRKFQQDIDAGANSSRFRDRLKFWRRDRDRQTCLANLKTWNKRLGMVVSRACREAEKRKAVSASKPGPPPLLRALSHKLFTALSRCWACSCDAPHEARFSLGSCQAVTHDLSHDGIAFDFLVSNSGLETEHAWKEGTIIIKTARSETSPSQAPSLSLTRPSPVLRIPKTGRS